MKIKDQEVECSYDQQSELVQFVVEVGEDRNEDSFHLDQPLQQLDLSFDKEDDEDDLSLREDVVEYKTLEVKKQTFDLESPIVGQSDAKPKKPNN